MATKAQIREELRRNISRVVSTINVNLLTGLRDATPRDTSYHASRWVGRVGGPPASRTTPKSRSGRAAALSFGQQNAAIAAIRAFRLGQGQVFISNDGDYIEQLNTREGNFVARVADRSVRGVSLAGTTLKR